MLVIALLAAAAAWSGVLILIMALARAAKVGDQALPTQSQVAAEPVAADVSAAVLRADRAQGSQIERSAHPGSSRVTRIAERQEDARPTAGEPRLSAAEAAEILGVVPGVLLGWEERYGYPSCTRSGGDPGTYRVIEVMALASAMHSGLSISAAVRTAMGVTARRFQTGHRPPGAQLPEGPEVDAGTEAG